MDEILKQIHYYAQQLKGINMWQAAGDYDYISSFLDSPRWNDGEYYGVVPRGEETVDEYSHNCPIPFTANRCLVSRCYDNDKALEILNKLSELFNTLKSDVSGDGLTAINAYIENTNLYIELLGGEPVPPGPEPPVYDTYYAGGIISPDTSIDFVVTKPDKTFFTVDNISLTGFMIPTSVENTVYGNQTVTSQNIVINNNDVDLILYDSNGEPITDQSKLYGIKSTTGTGTGTIPAEILIAYFSVDKSPIYNGYIQYLTLYDENGNKITYDSRKTYTSISYKSSYTGEDVPTSRAIINAGNTGYISYDAYYGTYQQLKYSESSPQSFTDLDTLRQMGLVSTYFDSQSRLHLKFSCAGTDITFTGSMDFALIISAVKQQITVDNIGLQGAVGPMGGMMTEYVPLPTVSMSYAYPNQLWNYSVNIGAGASSVLRDQNGNALSYDSTKSYSALKYYTSTSDSAGTIDKNVSIGASGSFLALFNNGSSRITVQRVNVSTCNSTDATIITVYDSSNNPYNAFKYTSDGTDYYYVLDGTQTDWTDDLDSIGYHLMAIFSGYVQQDKSSIPIVGNGYYKLYDENGNSIYKQSGKTYYYERAVGPNGETVNISARSPFGDFSGGRLVWAPLQSSPGGALVQKVEYTVE